MFPKLVIKSSRSSIDGILGKFSKEIYSKFPQKIHTPPALQSLNKDIFRKSIDQVKESFETLVKRYVQTIHTTPSTIPKVIAMEKRMAELGVKVCFADNVKAAKIITNAIEQLKAKGFKVPKQIFLITPKDPKSGGICPLKFADSEKSFIFINKDIENFAKKPDGAKSKLSIIKNMIKGKKQKEPALSDFFATLGIKKNATDTAEGVIYHEIGHFLHQDTRLAAKEAQKIWQTVSENCLDFDIAREVSMYASTGNMFGTGEEFVAEVFSGLMSGKKYSDKIMKLYNQLQGPKVL